MNRLASYRYTTVGNLAEMRGIAGFTGKKRVNDMAYLSF